MCIWIPLAPSQASHYQDIIVGLANETQSRENNWAVFDLLSSACNHLRLTHKPQSRNSNEKGWEKNRLIEEDSKLSLDEHYQSSQKLMILSNLLQKLVQEGHRTLIFSHRTRMLKMILKVVRKHLNFQAEMIDGTMIDSHRRQMIVNWFNEEKTLNCLLISSRLGVGLK